MATTSSPASSKTFKLNNGVIIPGVGFGTFTSEGAKGETYRAISHALKVSYRHLDCAWFYQNEDEVGGSAGLPRPEPKREAIRPFHHHESVGSPARARQGEVVGGKLVREASDGLR